MSVNSETDETNTDIMLYLDEDEYELAEKMAKKLGFEAVSEFIIHVMKYYLDSTDDKWEQIYQNTCED